MKIVISPAKSLDFERTLPVSDFTLPRFLNETDKLNAVLKKKSAKKLSNLMSISEALGELNYNRNQTRGIDYSPENARQAVFAFNGDVYLGLEAYTLNSAQIEQLQSKLRILSGLYGVLKPLDLIQPYRLEMGTKLKINRKPDLYSFWDKKVTQALNEELQDGEPFVNLASNEYFKVIKPALLKTPVITPVFKDFVNGQLKVVSFHAKRARGMMTRFIIDHSLEKAEELKTFNYGNYEFDANQSSDSELVFVR